MRKQIIRETLSDRVGYVEVIAVNEGAKLLSCEFWKGEISLWFDRPLPICEASGWEAHKFFLRWTGVTEEYNPTPEGFKFFKTVLDSENKLVYHVYYKAPED